MIFYLMLINKLRYGHITPCNDETSPKFEWEETLILNKCGAVQEDYEKYFQKGLDKLGKLVYNIISG